MTRLRRRDDREILDDGLIDGVPVDPGVLARSLRHVEAVDRWLGGDRALWGHLRPFLPPTGSVHILDVGTGNGTVLRRVGGRIEALGLRPRLTGLELDPKILALAAAEAEAGPVSLIGGDGLRIPLRDGSVDVAVAVLTLHHFDDRQAVALLREMARVARRAVLVSDLKRSIPAWLGARLLGATVWRANPVTRHDGPLSVLRGFTPGELLRLGDEAGLDRPRVSTHPVFRLILEGRP